jgi:pimeloyl-ACP methyl ester carboxylesterase
MLCVHGGAAHAHWFDFVAPGFTPDYHVRALDLRGHGDSAWAETHTYAWKQYSDDINTLTEKLDLRDYVLIGHSMGGMVSLVHAAAHPERIGRLVMENCLRRNTPRRRNWSRAIASKAGKSN